MLVTMILAWVTRWFVGPGASFFTFGALSGIVIAVLGGLSTDTLEVGLGGEKPIEPVLDLQSEA